AVLVNVVTEVGTVCGIDPRDEYTVTSKGKSYTDYTQFLDPKGLEGARIGLGKNYLGFHEEVDKAMEEVVKQMEAQGATVVKLDAITPNGLGRAGFDLMLYEFKDGVNKYLAQVKSDLPVKTLEDVIAWNKEHADQSMPFFDQEILEMAQKKGTLDDQEYKDAVAKSLRFNREEGIDKVMDEYKLDAIMGPTGGPAWPIDVVNGDHFGGGSSSAAARAGYPNITVPAGFIQGLPVGISIFGRAWSEPTLIKIAYAYEQATKHRKAPEFLPSIVL
ncbi:MAG: amidase family protein, partial [Bacteroidota bacterium]